MEAGGGGVEEKSLEAEEYSRASENQRARGKTGGRFLFRMKWIEMSGSGMGGRLQVAGDGVVRWNGFFSVSGY